MRVDSSDARGFIVNDSMRDIGAFELGATPDLEQDLIAHFQFEQRRCTRRRNQFLQQYDRIDKRYRLRK